jgi:hypothetical protein
MPPLYGDTLADQVGKRPYICEYHAEDIRSWSYDDGPNSDEFSTLLLRDHYYEYDPVFGLPTECKTRYRYLWKENGKVYVEFYDEKGELASETIELDVPMIPFVLWEISGSLLEDAGDYQVALLNMNSSDINFSVKANFAFYTEQYDPRSESPHLMPVGLDNPGEANGKGSVKEVRVGVAEGRRYPVGLERPDFVNPSPEPLRASMDKQEQMKREIRQLINLAVTNLEPTTPASAESKEFDEHSLESGLSYIGLELENGERKIAKFWAMYEGNKPATVNYPENYSLESTEVRISRGEKLQDLMLKIPSATYQKAVAKNIAKITVGPKISTEDMDKIESEIDGAPNMTSDPDTIKSDIEVGILSLGLASKLRGYPEGEVEKAKKDHEDRITRIALAQAEAAGAARGVPDASSNPAAGGKAEKEKSRDTTEDGKVSDKTRGEGK